MVFAFTSIVVSFAMFSVLEAYRVSLSPHFRGDDLLLVEIKSEVLRDKDIDLINNLPGVRATAGILVTGVLAPISNKRLYVYAVDPDAIMKVLPDLVQDPQIATAWAADRIGAIVDAPVAAQNGWKIGQHLTLQLDGGEVMIEMNVRGFYWQPQPFKGLLAHYPYVSGFLSIGFGNALVSVDNGVSSDRIAQSIDQAFRNSPRETSTSAADSVSKQRQKITQRTTESLTAIMAIAFVTMLLVTANVLSYGVREMMPQLAVLRVIGFTPLSVATLILAEASTLIFLGLGVGISAGYGYMASAKDNWHLVARPALWHVMGIASLLAAATIVLTAASPIARTLRMRPVEILQNT
jgi:putative ABC transport system permease protein